MSVQATTWVWANSRAKESTLLVALAIADGANKEGSESCQSVRTLGSMARCSESTVHRALKWLQDNGEIECIGTNPRYRNTNVYRFAAMWNPAWDSTPRGVMGDTSQNDTPVTGDTEGVSSEPSRGVTGGTQPQGTTPTTTPPSSADADARSAAFEKWWSYYPRKVAKIAARKAFDKALKDGAKMTDLGPGLERAILYWRTEETPLSKIPHPATWLNEGRWADEHPDAGPAVGTPNGEDEGSWMHRTE